MRFDWWTLALQAVNFAILVWLLQRFLYRPVLRFIDARRGDIEGQFQRARDAQAQAQALQLKAEEERAAIAAQRVVLLKAAEAEAEEAAKAQRARAAQEAEALLDGARKRIAREREQALGAAQEAALDLATHMARRLIDELPMRVRAEAWLERIEQHLAAMPKADLDKLVDGCAAGGTVTVVTAAVLPAEAAVQWRRRLSARLGDGAALAFDVDPKLIAGVELHLPNAVLRLSWQSALASLRAEITPHADAY